MKKKILLASLLLLLITPPLVTSSEKTSPASILTNSLKKTGETAKFNVSQTDETTVSKIVGTIIRAFLGLLGTIFLVLLVYAGYLWLTAGGNEEDVTKAKKLIAQAMIGLAIVMGAYAITTFVIDALKTSVTANPS